MFITNDVQATPGLALGHNGAGYGRFRDDYCTIIFISAGANNIPCKNTVLVDHGVYVTWEGVNAPIEAGITFHIKLKACVDG